MLEHLDDPAVLAPLRPDERDAIRRRGTQLRRRRHALLIGVPTALVVIAVAAVTLSGLPRSKAIPEPASSLTPTASPTPIATGAAAGLVAEPPIIRGDPAHHRAFIVIPLRNVGHRDVYPSQVYAFTTGGHLGGEVGSAADGVFLRTGSFAAIDAWAQRSRERQVLRAGGSYAWLIELDTDCRSRISPDLSSYHFFTGPPSPFGMGVSFHESAVPSPHDDLNGDWFPPALPKDTNVLTPPYPGWTLPEWVPEARAAACGAPGAPSASTP